MLRHAAEPAGLDGGVSLAREQFEHVFEIARRAGLDPRVDLLPVSPAQHYHMGGIATDDHGRTSATGLYACGEAASTGLHGANRLASNSLLEGLVFGARVADAIITDRLAVDGLAPDGLDRASVDVEIGRAHV